MRERESVRALCVGAGTGNESVREGKRAQSSGDDVDDGRIIHSDAQKKGWGACVVCVRARQRDEVGRARGHRRVGAGERRFSSHHPYRLVVRQVLPVVRP